MQIDRRMFIAGAAAVVPAVAYAQRAASPVMATLSGFVPRYLAAWNAPGLTLGLADAAGWSETAQFGVADLDTRRPIGIDERFHIGSITKSFTALMILQLAEEGKLSLDADVRDYLPGLPIKAPHGPITIHSLLCHGSGLPGSGTAPGWPGQTVGQAYKPGTQFYYSNYGYGLLGDVIEARGREPWHAALHRLILDPLAMNETSPMIGPGSRQFEVPSHVRREDDRPALRRAPLTRAPAQVFTRASGSIASTATDMNKYIRMLLRRGEGPNGRLISPAGFALMTRRHIDAEDFGPGAGYGYGWAVDRIGGNSVIRHTGGMISFMSSIHVDLDAGFGAFASINAQQNYRPVPVTKYAIDLYREAKAGRAAPRPPSLDLLKDVSWADYAGEYRHPDGRTMKVSPGAKALTLVSGGKSFTLEHLSGDAFVCTAPEFRLFTFLFTRGAPSPKAKKDAPVPVVGLSWARDTYVRPGAAMPAAPKAAVSLTPAELAGYEGLYVAEGGWSRGLRAFVRDGQLWFDSFDGPAALLPLGGDRFRYADEVAAPEVITFTPAAAPAPRALSYGEQTLFRVGDAFFLIA